MGNGTELEHQILRHRLHKIMRANHILPIRNRVVVVTNKWHAVAQYILGTSMFDGGEGLQVKMKLYASGRVGTSGDTLYITVYNRTQRKFMNELEVSITDTKVQLVSSNEALMPEGENLLWFLVRRDGVSRCIINGIQLNVWIEEVV